MPQPLPTAFSLYTVLREVCEQIEDVDCEKQLLIIGHLREELRSKLPHEITLVQVARTLAAEKSSFRILDRFADEVPGWQSCYPRALGNQLRWKKWFNIPSEMMAHRR